MRTFAEFQIIGRIGKIREVGSTLRVTVAADYGKKDKTGTYQTNPFWNEITIFNENVCKWVRENSKPGDLVHTRGTIRETSWTDKDGVTQYGVTLAAENFDNFSHGEYARAERKAS